MFSGPEAAFVEVQRVAYLATVYADGRPARRADLRRAGSQPPGVRLGAGHAEGPEPRRAIRSVAVGCDEYHEDWNELRQVLMHGQAYLVESGPEFERDRGLLYEKFPQYEADGADRAGDVGHRGGPGGSRRQLGPVGGGRLTRRLDASS